MQRIILYHFYDECECVSLSPTTLRMLGGSLGFLPGVVHLEGLIDLPKFFVNLRERLVSTQHNQLRRLGSDVDAEIHQSVGLGKFGFQVQCETHGQVFAEMVHMDKTWFILFSLLVINDKSRSVVTDLIDYASRI